MARKRMSNLNPEEPKKVEPAAEAPAKSTTPAPNAEPAAEAPAKTRTTEPQKIVLTQPLEIEVPAVEIKDEEPADQQSSASAPLQTSEAAPDSQDSEATIAELSASLEAAQQTARQRESELQEQITQLQAALEGKQTQVEALQSNLKDNQTQVEQLQSALKDRQTQIDQLQSSLEDRQTQVDQLQSELQQSGQLKAELADAKKMILQLSQVNAQPQTNAQPAPAAALPSQRRAAEPELESSSSQLIHPARSQARPQRDDRQPASALQRQPSYPSRPMPLPTSPEKMIPSEKRPPEKLLEQDGKLSDADLGWVD